MPILFFADALDGKSFQDDFQSPQRSILRILYDAFGHDRSDTLDETGTQVFLNAVNRCRHLRFVLGDLELLTELGMGGPFSLRSRISPGVGAIMLPTAHTRSFRP
jgi:hypothetical protein